MVLMIELKLEFEFIGKNSADNNYQYICTINKDNIPYTDFSTDFKFDEYVVKTFKDSNPKNYILGFDYD